MKSDFQLYFSILAAFPSINLISLKNKMSKRIILVLFMYAVSLTSFGKQVPSRDNDRQNGLWNVVVKKRVAGQVCDTCKIDFAVDAGPSFTYVMTGSGHTPQRFYALLNRIKAKYKGEYNASVQLVSNQLVGISFLPNFIIEKGKRIQLYRSYGGEDYSGLEFSATQNGRIIKPWTPLLQLGEDKNYIIPGMRSFHAGVFKLAINDSLNITVRNISTKKVIKTITIIRPKNKVDDFLFYQLPAQGEQLSNNLQHILNLSSGIPKTDRGNTSKIFNKDYGTIGILRFGELGNDVLQYSYKKQPYQWKSIKPLNPDNAAYIILGNDMPGGKEQDIYLRYNSQPEIINEITIRVKQRPFLIPWGKVAMMSIVLLAVGGTWFYLRERRNKQKLAALKHKSEDTEAQLLLLSGQLNPHFLFNSLNAIQGTFNSSPERANAYIGNVAGFMRDVMDNGRKEFISLQEELQLEAEYLALELERVSFSYSINVASEISPAMIDFPPLLLQPILENSIRHAFNSELTSPTININVFDRENTLQIEITDNGCKSWDSITASEGHGLSLIRKRIAIYNQRLENMPIQMKTNFREGTGTITIFTFQNWLV